MKRICLKLAALSCLERSFVKQVRKGPVIEEKARMDRRYGLSAQSRTLSVRISAKIAEMIEVERRRLREGLKTEVGASEVTRRALEAYLIGEGYSLEITPWREPESAEQKIRRLEAEVRKLRSKK